MKTDLKKAKELVKSGLTIKAVADKLKVNYKTLYYHLAKDKDVKSPQSKAWETRKKQEAIDKYNSSTSSGIKASIARKFHAEYGVLLKEVLSAKIEPIIKEKKTPKVAPKKVSFEQKEADLILPFPIKQLIEKESEKIYEKLSKEFNQKFEALEKLLIAK